MFRRPIEVMIRAWWNLKRWGGWCWEYVTVQHWVATRPQSGSPRPPVLRVRYHPKRWTTT